MFRRRLGIIAQHVSNSIASIPKPIRPGARINKWTTRNISTCSLLREKSSSEPDHKTEEEKEALARREHIFGTIPNIMTMARIGASPIVSYWVITGEYKCAMGLFFVAGLLDVADGIVARNFPGQKSVLGSFLDPLADKILVASGFISLAVAGHINPYLASLVVARDVGLVTAAFLLRAKTKRPEEGFFDTTTAVAPEVRPSLLSKANTGCQLSLVTLSLFHTAFPTVSPELLEPTLTTLQIATAITTLGSWIGYVRQPGMVPRN